MPRRLVAALVGVGSFAGLSMADIDRESTTVPTPQTREFDWRSSNEWRQRHDGNAAAARANHAAVVFYGDSIMEAYASAPAFRALKQGGALSLGTGGDMTQHLLWRLDNGEIGSLQPEVVVVLIGINNFGHQDDSPEDVSKGVVAVARKLRAKLPEAKLVVLGILPSGQFPDDPLRARIKEANRLTAAEAAEVGFRFEDIGAAFLQEDGSISSDIMPDYLHPSPRGYEVFTDAVKPFLP